MSRRIAPSRWSGAFPFDNLTCGENFSLVAIEMWTALSPLFSKNIVKLERLLQLDFLDNFMRDLLPILSSIQKEFESIQIPSLAAQVERLIQRADKDESTTSLYVLCQELRDRIEYEMGRCRFFMVPPEDRTYLELQIPPEVEHKFSSARYDLKEAGKCFALSLPTACVFHLMRSLEPGLGSLAKAVDVGKEKDNWNDILNLIEKKLRERKDEPKEADWKEKEQFYSQAATNFRFFKNAWRNHVAHFHEKYTREEAKEIFDAVLSFLKHIATHLSE